MRINNIGYLIKEGVRGIFLHGFMSFAAVCVTVACLMIVGSFSILTYNVSLMVEDLNKTNEILVYVDSALPDAEAKSVGTPINRLENVASIRFVSREEARDSYVEQYDEDELYQDLEAEIRTNPLLISQLAIVYKVKNQLPTDFPFQRLCQVYQPFCQIGLQGF